MFFIRSLRNYRALAIKFVLEWQAEGEAMYRARESALILAAAAVWLLTGLHSSPDNGSSSRQLMAAVLPHVATEGADLDILAYGIPCNEIDPAEEDEEEDDESTDDDDDIDQQPQRARQRRDAVSQPAFPYGLVFLHCIRVGPSYPVPRLNKSKDAATSELSATAFRYFFGVDIENIMDS